MALSRSGEGFGYVHFSVETERLIERTARTHGRSPDQIVQEALDVAFRKSPTSDWKALSKSPISASSAQ
jgi:hypothetical protein